MLADVPLQPFTEAEGPQLLADKGVTDERVVQVILNVSGGALLVATLAENQPTDPSQVGDPSGDAVERFLKWETDPVRRSLAVAAALPRVVNEDILGILTAEPALEESERGRLFAWLRSLPFVSHDAGRCVYHEVVRTAMIGWSAPSPRPGGATATRRSPRRTGNGRPIFWSATGGRIRPGGTAR